MIGMCCLRQYNMKLMYKYNRHYFRNYECFTKLSLKTYFGFCVLFSYFLQNSHPPIQYKPPPVTFKALCSVIANFRFNCFTNIEIEFFIEENFHQKQYKSNTKYNNNIFSKYQLCNSKEHKH